MEGHNCCQGILIIERNATIVSPCHHNTGMINSHSSCWPSPILKNVRRRLQIMRAANLQYLNKNLLMMDGGPCARTNSHPSVMQASSISGLIYDLCYLSSWISVPPVQTLVLFMFLCQLDFVRIHVHLVLRQLMVAAKQHFLYKVPSFCTVFDNIIVKGNILFKSKKAQAGESQR